MSYLEPTQESGRRLLARGIGGPVVMLNLLRFRAIADYAANPALAPPAPISGEAAYRLYMEHTTPHLERSGGEVIFFGRGGPFLVGPDAERWDAALLVRQASVAAFMAFASNPAYLAGIGHRTAALEDSRLLPLVEDARGGAPDSPSLLGVEHVQLAMPPGGEGRARAFYTGLLGIPEQPKPPHLAKRGGVWFESERVKLHLGVEPDFRPARKAHPALLVAGLAALVRALRAAGCPVADDEPLEGYSRVYVSDPFGNRIELMEPLG